MTQPSFAPVPRADRYGPRSGSRRQQIGGRTV